MIARPPAAISERRSKNRRLPRFSASPFDYTPPPSPLVEIIARIDVTEAGFLRSLKKSASDSLGEWIHRLVWEAWINSGAEGGEPIAPVVDRSSGLHLFWSNALVGQSTRGVKLEAIRLVISRATWDRISLFAESWSLTPESLIRGCVSMRVRQLRRFFDAYPEQRTAWRKENA